MTDCTVCGQNPGEVCRGCYGRLDAEADDRLDRVADAGDLLSLAEHEVAALRAERDALEAECQRLEGVLAEATAERDRLLAAVKEHHSQRADDRCVEDDDRLYAAAGLPPCDRRVGSKEEMLANCARFIERRCEGGGWPSYRELEAERDAALAEAERLRGALRGAYEDAARVVVAGGDGVDRLETAIQYGPNAAIAEAVLARGEEVAGG